MTLVVCGGDCLIYSTFYSLHVHLQMPHVLFLVQVCRRNRELKDVIHVSGQQATERLPYISTVLGFVFANMKLLICRQH